MEYPVSLSSLKALTDRLNLEIVTHLNTHLKDHIEVDIVASRKLSTGIIFALETEYQRLEIVEAYIPITQRTGSDCSISQTNVKFFCGAYARDSRTSMWIMDRKFGTAGYQVFTLADIDEDSIEAAAALIATEMLNHLAHHFA